MSAAPGVRVMNPIMSLAEAATFTPFSKDYLVQCANSTGRHYLPTFRAARNMRCVHARDLLAWMDTFEPD